MTLARIVSVTLPLALFHCAPSAPDTPEPATSTTEVAETSPTASAAPTASAQATQTPAADTRVRDACAKLCDRVKSSCPKGRGEACIAQCAGDEARSKGCEAEAEAAMTCQAKASGGFCENIAAPGCTEAYLRLQRCQRGEKQETATSPAQSEPDGWERVKDEGWGVSVLMPKGAAVDTQAKSRTWKATFDGATYEIVELPKPKKMEQNTLVKLVLSHVGISCQKEMRLTGRVDRDTVTTTRFETACKSGDKLYGRLRVDEQRALSMLVRGAAKPEHREAFLDSMR